MIDSAGKSLALNIEIRKMEVDKKKPALSSSDVEKAISKLIKSAVESLTQLADEAPSGCFCRRVIQLKPAQVTPFTFGAIQDLIRAKMPMAPDCMIKVCDAFITTYPNEIFMKFMEFATIRNIAEYQTEQFDCDDFSMTFCALARKWHSRLRAQLEGAVAIKSMLPVAAPAPPGARVIPHCCAAAVAEERYIGGSPVGMCHGKLAADGGEHAFNFWISPTGDIVFIEPQTGEFITFGAGAVIDFVYI